MYVNIYVLCLLLFSNITAFNSKFGNVKSGLFLRLSRKNTIDGCDNRYETIEDYKKYMKRVEEEIQLKRNQIKMEYINMLNSKNYSDEEKIRIVERNINNISYIYNITKGIELFEEL